MMMMTRLQITIINLDCLAWIDVKNVLEELISNNKINNNK